MRPHTSPQHRREHAVKSLRTSDKLANFSRLITRTSSRLLKWLQLLSSARLLRWIMIICIITNIIDSAAKSYLEITTNLETGLLYFIKVAIPLARLGLAMFAMTMIPYTPIFNAIDMLLGAMNKGTDTVVAKYRGAKDTAQKFHDFIVAAATFTGAALMLTVAPVFGEVLLLVSTYYYIMDAFGLNPWRQNEISHASPHTNKPASSRDTKDDNVTAETTLKQKPINHYAPRKTQRFSLFHKEKMRTNLQVTALEPRLKFGMTR